MKVLIVHLNVYIITFKLKLYILKIQFTSDFIF